MKRSLKISLWVIGSLAVLVIGVFMSADIIASRLVQKQVRKSFAEIPEAEAKIGHIYLNLLSGSAIVRDITFLTNSLAREDSVTGRREPGLAVHIPTLAIWNISYLDLIKQHRASVFKISVNDPQLLVYLDEKHPESLLPVFPEDTTLEKAQSWLEAVELKHLELVNLQLRLHSTTSPLNISVDSLSTECCDLCYNIRDSLFAYNDSVYELRLGAAKIKLPTEFINMEIHNLQTKNQGPLNLGYTRVYHDIKPTQLADLKREPTTWIDLEVNRLSTSPLNPIRKALAQDYTLDALQVDCKRIHIHRDARYPAKIPYGTPQDFLRKIPVPFLVKKIDGKAKKVDVEFASTDINCGEMHLKNGRAVLTNITNHKGATWKTYGKAPFGEQGLVEAHYDFHLDKDATFSISIAGKGVETADLNPFIRPLIGITSDCHIDRIDAVYKGDRNKATGTFCMQYHGLNVKVHKEDKIPYEVVSKNADFFTSLANTLVPKNNPTSVDPAPRQYDVEWKRDEWKPYPLFLFGPCIDGVKKTMLPGLYVHKQTQKKKK